MSSIATTTNASLDRSMKVRVVEEVLVDIDDAQRPGLCWHPRNQRDGNNSVVGLLTTGAAGSGPEAVPPMSAQGDNGTAPALPLRLTAIIDRCQILSPLQNPRLLGMCDGGGMVFEENELGALPRRWTVFPLDASGLVVA